MPCVTLNSSLPHIHVQKIYNDMYFNIVCLIGAHALTSDRCHSCTFQSTHKENCIKSYIGDISVQDLIYFYSKKYFFLINSCFQSTIFFSSSIFAFIFQLTSHFPSQALIFVVCSPSFSRQQGAHFHVKYFKDIFHSYTSFGGSNKMSSAFEILTRTLCQTNYTVPNNL